MPIRHQLSRRAGWRMPRGAVKVDRSTKLGNPFVVGRHGTREECVAWHRDLIECGCTVAFVPIPIAEQLAHYRYVRDNIHKLIGADVACWCRLDQICHGDNYLRLAGRIKCEEAK